MRELTGKVLARQYLENGEIKNHRGDCDCVNCRRSDAIQTPEGTRAVLDALQRIATIKQQIPFDAAAAASDCIRIATEALTELEARV